MMALRLVLATACILNAACGSRSMVDLVSQISKLELEATEYSGVNLSTSNLEQHKIFARVGLNPCRDKKLATLLIEDLELREGTKVTKCEQLAGGRIAEAFAVSLKTGDKSETVFMKTDQGNSKAERNFNEVQTVTDLDNAGFIGMPKLKAIISFKSREYIVTEFLPRPWTMLKDFLFLNLMGAHSFKKVEMTWEEALKAFRLIVKAVLDMKKALPGLSHCDLHSGNIMVRGDSSEGQIEEVKLIDFGMAVPHSCPKPHVSDLQWLRTHLFSLLANVNPGIHRDVEKWRNEFKQFALTNSFSSDAMEAEFNTDVRPHDRAGTAVPKLAPISWWDKRGPARDKVEEHCEVCKTHSQEIAQFFEGEIGSVGTKAGADNSVGFDLIGDLLKRISIPIDPIDVVIDAIDDSVGSDFAEDLQGS